MGRPRIPVGTHGKINVVEIRKKSKGKPAVWEARTWFRARNGRLLRPRRRGPTEPAAERNLKEALTRLVDEVKGKLISSETRFGHVCDLWLAEFEKKVARGERAPKTLYDYRDTIRLHIKPKLGELTCKEVEDDVAACNEAIQEARKGVANPRRARKQGDGYTAAARTRAVLGQVCGFAVRHKAMVRNPAKDCEPVERSKSKKRQDVVVLEAGERRTFLGRLNVWCVAYVEGDGGRSPEEFVAGVAAEGPLAELLGAVRSVDRSEFLASLAEWYASYQAENKANRKYNLGARGRAWLDLPDIATAGLGTGGRLGELLALTGDEVEPPSRTAELAYHLVRVEKVGIVRVEGRKGGEPPVTVRYPSWATPMFRRRKLESGGGPLFATWNGGWEDISNVTKRFRKACDAIGFDYVASHVLRHTTGTHLGDNDVSNEAIGDQLGNTPAIVQQNYRRKRQAIKSNAEVLESMFDTPDEDGSDGDEAEDVV